MNDATPDHTHLPRRAAAGRRLAAVLALYGSLALPASADATVVVEGRLLARDGQPTAGRVVLTPSPTRMGTFPEIGAAAAGKDGRFRINITDPSVLRQYALDPKRSRTGDYTAYALRANGDIAQQSFSGLLDGRGEATRVRDVKRPRSVPTIRLRIGRPAETGTAGSETHVSPPGIPYCSGTAKVVSRTVASAAIGELNNAYPGTSARFEYGGGGTIGMIQDGRFSGLLVSDFRYQKVGYIRGCGPDLRKRTVETLVRQEKFLGGLIRRRAPGGLDGCRATRPGASFPGGSEFRRTVREPARATDDEPAFGVPPEAAARLRLRYRFGAATTSTHYICGRRVASESPMETIRSISGLAGG